MAGSWNRAGGSWPWGKGLMNVQGQTEEEIKAVTGVASPSTETSIRAGGEGADATG